MSFLSSAFCVSHISVFLSEVCHGAVLLNDRNVVQMASETCLDVSDILLSERRLLLFLLIRKSYGLGFMVKFIDSVDLFLFHVIFCPLCLFPGSAVSPLPEGRFLPSDVHSREDDDRRKRLRKAPEYAGIPFLRVNTLDIIQQRKFAALICFKECSDLLTL